MRRGRQVYYDAFSRFYDRFVALHSRDKQGLARKFLVDQIPVENVSAVLDLCTGTGTLLTHLQARHSRVVLYGDMLGLFAARAYFTLDYLGRGSSTALLDGGLENWTREFGAVRGPFQSMRLRPS